MAAVIELENVFFTVQGRDIIKDFSMQLIDGKTTALAGPSGSGKTTLLKLASGILVPSKGEVNFRGDDIFSMNRHETLTFRKQCSLVFQDSALWANKSIYESLELPLMTHFPEMKPADRRQRVAEVLKIVGYSRDTSIRPDKLSMGEQKLIAFARALMCGPTILFLDEWTESLDEPGTQRLIRLVQSYKKELKTIVLVSHDMRIIKTLADFVVMIDEGQFKRKISREEMEEDEKTVQYIEEGMAS